MNNIDNTSSDSGTYNVPDYNVPDLAALQQCTERHVRNMADAGQIPGMYRFGRLVRFRRAAVDAWLDAGAPSLTERSE